MWGTSSRQVFKRALSFSRVKILYTRITLTRVTTCYFVFTVIACIVLSVSQGIAFRDNSQAISAIGSIIGTRGVNGSLVVLEKNTLQTCSSIPNQRGTDCVDILTFGSTDLQTRGVNSSSRDLGESLSEEVNDFISSRSDDDNENEDEIGESDVHVRKTDNKDDDESDDEESDEDSVALEDNVAQSLSDTCITALQWLDDTIHDAQREDVVTFVFQLWLFVLAVVTILNESIPHLVAGFLGHVLGTAWSGYRISSTKALKVFYQNSIVPEACDAHDMLGNWWDVRIRHAIPVVVMNAIALIVLFGLSYKLFSVYAKESFSRVGASAKIHRMYKVVLLFSVCLQLSAFFSLASTAMWIDKISHDSMMRLAHHSKLYLAAFIVTLVLTFPWFYLGWVCVRKECQIRFWAFIAISLLFITISTVMFTSPLYVYIFISWRLFGAMSVTSYALAVATAGLAVVCRLNFGKGLAHYLQVSDALEGMDFAPVIFSNIGNNDLEKRGSMEKKLSPATFMPPTTVNVPPVAFRLNKPLKQRGSSIYSEENGTAVYLSSSPPLISDLAPAPNHLSSAASKRSVYIPYPSLTDIHHQMNETRKSRVLQAAAPSLVESTASSPTPSVRRNGSLSSTDGSPRKVGLPANPRSARSSPIQPF